MTNLIDNTESTGRRFAGPAALVLLAAGGMTAAIARSSDEEGQPGLSVPPLTAQALAVGSPLPDASPAPETKPPALVAATPTDPVAAPPVPAADPAVKALAIPAPEPSQAEAAVAPNRFAETFAAIEPAATGSPPPATLALEQPQPATAMVLREAELPASAPAPELAPAAQPASEVVPQAAAPALQLVATEPVPAAPAISAAQPVAELAIATAAPAIVPTALTAAPVAATPPIAEAAAPVAAEPAPAELAPQAAAPAVSAVQVALASPEPAPAAAPRTFVSEPVVQPLPVSAAPKPVAAATPAPQPAKPVQLVARPAKAKSKIAPEVVGTRLGGAMASNFQLTDGTIDYKIGARVNGGEAHSLPLRITRDDQLSVRLGDLLSLVKPQMDPALFAYLSASRGAEEYVSFAAIRATGIDIRYDAARDQLLLGVE